MRSLWYLNCEAELRPVMNKTTPTFFAVYFVNDHKIVLNKVKDRSPKVHNELVFVSKQKYIF